MKKQNNNTELASIFTGFIHTANETVQSCLTSQKVFLRLQEFILQQIDNRRGFEDTPCFCKKIKIDAEREILEKVLVRLAEIQKEEMDAKEQEET